MSVDAVKRYLKAWGKDVLVQEFQVSSATVELAAKALGVEEARIAKTLSFRAPSAPEDQAGAPPAILVVAAGDAKVDSGKFKRVFGVKSKMLSPEEALAATGHAVGGVCPFALKNPLAKVYLDISLRRFQSVFPACGSANSCIELTCPELFACSAALDWVDVCRGWNCEEMQK
ncbi:YbaK/EbsC family protein [Desulfovibrio sp. OttesenSCG-928-C14]|nr:YbaK/EbsC family protein [Desulfovibrio sp. OttesenSCG-928-C14]